MTLVKKFETNLLDLLMTSIRKFFNLKTFAIFLILSFECQRESATIVITLMSRIWTLTEDQFGILWYCFAQAVYENRQASVSETIQDSESASILLARTGSSMFEIRHNPTLPQLLQQPCFSGAEKRWNTPSSTRFPVPYCNHQCGHIFHEGCQAQYGWPPH